MYNIMHISIVIDQRADAAVDHIVHRLRRLNYRGRSTRNYFKIDMQLHCLHQIYTVLLYLYCDECIISTYESDYCFKFIIFIIHSTHHTHIIKYSGLENKARLKHTDRISRHNVSVLWKTKK